MTSRPAILFSSVQVFKPARLILLPSLHHMSYSLFHIPISCIIPSRHAQLTRTSPTDLSASSFSLALLSRTLDILNHRMISNAVTSPIFSNQKKKKGSLQRPSLWADRSAVSGGLHFVFEGIDLIWMI